MNTNTPPASPKPGDSYVQSFARVSPVCAATPLSVCCGAVAPNERITSSPRANDCTYLSPGFGLVGGALAFMQSPASNSLFEYLFII